MRVIGSLYGLLIPSRYVQGNSTHDALFDMPQLSRVPSIA